MRIKFIQNLINLLRHKKTYTKINGKNNIVSVPNGNKVKVVIYGSNNQVLFDDSVVDFMGFINIGLSDCYVNNCVVKVGAKSTSNGVSIRLLEDNSLVVIGNDCMLSEKISIDCSDTHAVYDKDTAQLLNIGKSIEIGNHVWVGKNVAICKNSSIPDNCIVGMGSIITKKFTDKNCVIAGVPAKVCKRNVNWSRLCPKQFLQKMAEKEG